jgi:malate dehydrogenase (oxaloacetate-decarboxylating)(NADP+)
MINRSIIKCRPCGPLKGESHAKNPVEFQGVSTPLVKREELGLRGLLPAAYLPLDQEVERCMSRLREKPDDLEKYVYLRNIQDVNENLFYAMLTRHTAELMPIVYTPTVGKACEEFSHIYRGALRGLYLTLNDAGSIREILNNWPYSDVTTIVVTDGERILGLGDLGVNGMGIPIGKLALYSACAGIHPAACLPVHIDVGTNNEANLKDPYYLGLNQQRERGPKYDALIAEFFEAAQDKFGENVLIQFEDFGNTTAFRLLEQWQDKACTFNDDVQGTASVALAGLLSSKRITGKSLSDHTFLFNGAGEAGTGIASLIAYAVSIESGCSLEEARESIFLVDSKGLVTKNRGDFESLPHHKIPFAHDVPLTCPNLACAVNNVKPSVLIGVSAQPKTFTRGICSSMATFNDRPIICALSNPTSKAECTAEEAYTWTDGKAIFSSGSPFAPVTLEDGRTFVPGQGNNAYVFPGVGLGALASGAKRLTDHDMYVAANALAEQVTDAELESGSLYPSLDRIRNISAHVAVAVAKNAYETNVATKPRPENLLEHIQDIMYDPFDETKSKASTSTVDSFAQ